MIVYRICKARYTNTVFSGAGGLEASGRWHQRGRPVIYTSGTLSLAALEYLVHLGRRDAKIALVSAQATVPEDLIAEPVGPASLPRNWQASPPGKETMAVGTTWLVEGRSAILRVPSALIAGEFNYLLNSQHPDFKRIRMSAPVPFSFDARLLK